MHGLSSQVQPDGAFVDTNRVGRYVIEEFQFFTASSGKEESKCNPIEKSCGLTFRAAER